MTAVTDLCSGSHCHVWLINIVHIYTHMLYNQVPTGLQFMLLHPTPLLAKCSLVSTPTCRWQEGNIQLDGALGALSWGLWSFALHPSNQWLPCQPGDGGGSVFDLALFLCPLGERPIKGSVLERYEAYFCEALRQLGADRGPFSFSCLMCTNHPPPCLNFLTGTQCWLPLGPQHRLIVSRLPHVSGEKREKSETPSLSPPLVPPDPSPIF